MIEALIGAVIGAGAIALAWWQGRRNGRAEVQQQRVEAAASAEVKRMEIESNVAKESDLVGRARRAGLVRPED